MESIAIMQPYFLPYIGYFQLIAAVDRFIFYDDVDFIKNGWINRNRILINGEPKYLTIPCKNVSSNKKIKQTEHALDHRSKHKLLKKIRFAYCNAPFFDRIYSIVRQVFEKKTDYVSEFAIESVVVSSEYLGLECSFSQSSKRYKNKNLDAADRLIDICKQEGISNYINAAGGQKMYEKPYFKDQAIKLSFLEPQKIEYQQFDNEFVPWLSILDVMMFNSPEKIRTDFLESRELV